MCALVLLVLALPANSRVVDDSVDALVERLDKSSPLMRTLLEPYIADMRSTVNFARISGVTRPIQIDPLMLGYRNAYFANGVCFLAARKNKRSDVLAAGGR